MTLTIVSGAAPGVEQGAIEAAVNLALRWTGWASEQSILSILTIPPVYRTGLQSTSATDPGMVRRINIQGCDGALVFSTSMVLAGVAAFVDRWTERMGRAFLHVTLNPALFGGAMWTAVDGSKVDRRVVGDEVIERVRAWIRDLPSGRVYVTGPSADDVPGIQGATRDALIAILEPFAVDEVRETTRALSLIEQAATVTALNRRAVERDIEAAVSVPTPLRIGDPDDHHEANMAALGFGPPGDRYRLGSSIGAVIAQALDANAQRGEPFDLRPATRADLEDLDAVPDPVDSAVPLHVHQTPPVNLVVSNATEPGFVERTIARCQRDGAHLVLGDSQRCRICNAHLDDLCTRRIPCIVTAPPEGLDEIQRARLDASIREAEREIRDEPPAPGDQTA